MSTDRGHIRWQCRRALLELDLTFAKFLASERFEQLNEQQLKSLVSLLTEDDYKIWNWINQIENCPNSEWEEIIKMLS